MPIPERVEAIWLLIMILFLITELGTAGLTTIWFAAGSSAAFLLSLAGVETVWQVGIFMAVSVILFAFTRPLALKKTFRIHYVLGMEAACANNAVFILI